MIGDIEILVDLSEAGLDLEPDELEAYTQQLAEELKDGLVEDATLMRESEAPESSKAGGSGFKPGLIKVINPANFKTLLDSLGNRVYGSLLEIEFGDVKLKYRNSQQLEEQLQALERISQIRIRVISNRAEDN